MDQKIKMVSGCSFCDSKKFEIPHEYYKPQEGELVKCQNCGTLNDSSFLNNIIYENKKGLRSFLSSILAVD